MLYKNKKGQVLGELGKLGIGVVTLAIVLVITFLIMAQAQSQIITIDSVNVSDATSFSAGYNATVTLQNAVNDIPEWVPIIIITAIGALLLGMIQMFRRSAT